MISSHRRGQVEARLLPSPAFLRALVGAVIRSEKSRVGDVAVMFVDRPIMKNLHGRFLNQKRDTDVMAFPMPSKKGLLSGDIVVCVPVAKQNAQRFDDEPRREVARLIVHGLLHLLGYDDHRPRDRARMWKEQEALVERLFPRK